MKIKKQIHDAILEKAQTADPAKTTARQIWGEVCAEFGSTVSYSKVWRLIKSVGVELTGNKTVASSRSTEQRREAGRKSWETRRRRAAARDQHLVP